MLRNTTTPPTTSRQCCSYCTCTDCDGLHELVSPGVGSHHQRQVGLLDQLVHRALCDTMQLIHH